MNQEQTEKTEKKFKPSDEQIADLIEEAQQEALRKAKQKVLDSIVRNGKDGEPITDGVPGPVIVDLDLGNQALSVRS